MKIFNKIIIIFILIVFFSCKITINTNNPKIEIITDSLNTKKTNNLKFIFKKGSGHNHPTFAIWIEDMQGNYIKTLYITKAYATGIFPYAMQGDSIWLNKPGQSYQPAALPYWSFKVSKNKNVAYIPSPKTTDAQSGATKKIKNIDAYSGATPKADFIYETFDYYQAKPFRILVEINQTWDWNKFWTNDKFIDNNAYKHSAQPSVIYAVTVNSSDNELFLNPIGHGDPKGETGKLYTNLSTLTTAKEIFESIKIELKK